jgi:hypothetical protein
MKGFEDKIKRNIKWIFWGLLILGLFLGIKLIFEIKQFETKILSEREKLYYMKYLISYKVPVKKGFVMSDFKKGLQKLNISVDVLKELPEGVELKTKISLEELARFLNWLQKENYKVELLQIKNFSENQAFDVRIIVK